MKKVMKIVGVIILVIAAAVAALVIKGQIEAKKSSVKEDIIIPSSLLPHVLSRSIHSPVNMRFLLSMIHQRMRRSKKYASGIHQNWRSAIKSIP